MSSAPKPMVVRCFQCSAENSPQSFCGTCGAPLQLQAYIGQRVNQELVAVTRERDLVERETAIRIFERVFGWAKMFVWVALAVTIPLAALGIYKWSDLLSAVNTAKQSVTETVAGVRRDLAGTMASTRKEIAATSEAAKQDIKSASGVATTEAHAARTSIAQAKKDIGQERVDVQNQIDGVRGQLKSAGELQPEITTLRQQLGQARQDIEDQKKVLASSQEFAKQIFQSYETEYFQGPQTPADRIRVLPRKQGNGATVYLLLSDSPILQTTQLQWKVFAQPRNSYFTLHNLLIFAWGDPAQNLNDGQLSVAYFPDKSDKELIKSLSDRDGRAFADGEPLPRMNEPDTEFKGNKWMPTATQEKH
jgi:hypothetical protein